MRKLKLAYFGSPGFSAALLESLLQDNGLPIEIVLVVTQPDKPVGKKHTVTPSPVKVIAEKYHIPCWDTRLLDNEEKLIDILKTIDIALVFAYGFKELIPQRYLEAPLIHFDVGGGKRSGFINIHPSLLPLYRGSSPIAYPLILGDRETGVTLFVMDEKMDHGPIAAQEKIPVTGMRPDMETNLTQLGLNMIKKLLNELAVDVNNVVLKAQNHSGATRAPYMTKDDGFLPLSVVQKALKNDPLTFEELPQILQNYLKKYHDIVKSEGSGKLLFNFWRGMHPWPGVWTRITVNGQEKRLLLNEMKLENGQLYLTKVQLEGKKEVDFPTFLKAYGSSW